jgi:putative protease
MKAAIHYGADAVYLGGKKFSLRAHASNFSEEEMRQAVKYAHQKKVKVYVTVNILAHQEDLRGLEEYLLFLREILVDGIIISDPGIMMLTRECIPQVPIHLSTQANVTNPVNARFWQSQGVARLNLARELSLSEIAAVRKALDTKTQIEVFVHGALCISYSGRCLLSYYFTGRDANRGECAHPCRYKYVLQEEKRPGQYFPVEEDEHGTYIFNSRDLCLLNTIPQLIKNGVDSLKIEGRMKTVYYVGAVVRVYRAALDYLAGQIKAGEVGTRGYTENFIFGPPGAEDMLYDRPRIDQEYVPVGVIQSIGTTPRNENCLDVEIRNPIRKGETIEYLGRGINAISLEVLELLDEDNMPMEQANPGNIVKILYTTDTETDWQTNSLLRKKK